MQGPGSARGRRLRRCAAMATLVACASLATPWTASSLALAGGADKPRPATFGDCPHSNAGVHDGYDCEVVSSEGGGGLPT